MKKRGLTGLLITAASTAVLAGAAMTAQADTPADIWDYTEIYDEDDNIIYDFKEVEVTLPANWEGKYDISTGTNFIEFYQPSSREAYTEALGFESYAGTLFNVCYSQDYGFMDTQPNYQIIGSGEQGIYYLTLPTDVQGYPDDPEIWAEWAELTGDLEWIKENVTMLNPGEGVVSPELVTPSSSAAVQTGSEYILPDSSIRYLSESDLSGMTADELQMAINEIYARHHRKFVTKSIQDYFNAKSWYSGTVEPSKFDETSLNQYEGKNIALMIQCMNYAPSGSSTSVSQTGGAAVSAASGSVLYATATVNIRSTTSTSGSIMGIVPQGYSVTVTGNTVNGWIPVNYNGIRGYILQDYLTASGTNSSAQSSGSQTGSSSQSTPADNNTITNTDSGQTSASVQLYAGAYKDGTVFAGDGPITEYYALYVSNITDTSFDFALCLMDMATDSVTRTIVGPNAASFTADGTMASYRGQDCNLDFYFPNYHNAYPVVTDIEISGLDSVSGITFVNNAIPGHEFS